MTASQSLFDRLSKSHAATHNPFAMEIWANFATTVADAVTLAGSKLEVPEIYAAYTSRLGWWRRKQRLNSIGTTVRIPSEDAITDALVEQLEELRNDARPGNPLMDMNITFAGQQPRRRQNHIGSPAFTTDIRAYVPDDKNLDIRIEAKVLFEAKDLHSEYLGARGLLRFGDPENPYSDTPVGAMLGFIVAPSPEPWTSMIHNGLAQTVRAIDVGHVSVGKLPNPVSVCDMMHSRDERVTVLHLSIVQNTEPSSWY